MELPDVAANVRAELARQRKPQRALQERLGISRGSMHRRLSGQSPFHSNELVETANFLGLAVADLFAAERVTA